jgi:hypothetical protein
MIWDILTDSNRDKIWPIIAESQQKRHIQQAIHI